MTRDVVERFNNLSGELLELTVSDLLSHPKSTADFVAPSKMAKILVSGRTIVATALIEIGIIERYENCGILILSDNPKAVELAHESSLNNHELRIVQANGSSAGWGAMGVARDIVGNLAEPDIVASAIENQELTYNKKFAVRN